MKVELNLLDAYSLGLLTGLAAAVAVKFMYRKTLLLCAKAGTAEKLPDGRFYRIIEEAEANAAEDALARYKQEPL